MAATITAVGTIPLSGQVPGQRRHTSVQITFDASYPTGGYAITPASVGLVNIDTAILGCTQLGRIACWNQATGKIQLFSATTTEVASTTDVHADSVVARFIGE